MIYKTNEMFKNGQGKIIETIRTKYCMVIANLEQQLRIMTRKTNQTYSKTREEEKDGKNQIMTNVSRGDGQIIRTINNLQHRLETIYGELSRALSKYQSVEGYT